jgi:GNAT superfamily N-acetyltransferase
VNDPIQGCCTDRSTTDRSADKLVGGERFRGIAQQQIVEAPKGPNANLSDRSAAAEQMFFPSCSLVSRMGDGVVAIEYILRPATYADRAWLESLRRAAYRDLFDATWGGWDEARHRRHFSEFWEAGCISIITVSGHPVGVLQLFKSGDVVEIGEIQVLPEHQNRGIGTRILSDVIECAKNEGKPAALYLGLKNQGALRLYERLGFEETGRSDTHIFMTHPCG